MKRGQEVLVILVLITATSCVAWQGRRSPRLEKPRIFPDVAGSPQVRLVIGANDADEGAAIRRSIQKVRPKFSYLATAGEYVDEFDYAIDLSASLTDNSDSGYNTLAYAMRLLVPAIVKEEFTVEAAVRDADGRPLGKFQATGRVKLVAQFHLLWVSPITAPLAARTDRKMHVNTFRDVFIQVGEAIAEHQRSVRGGAEVASASAVPAQTGEADLAEPPRSPTVVSMP